MRGPTTPGKRPLVPILAALGFLAGCASDREASAPEVSQRAQDHLLTDRAAGSGVEGDSSPPPEHGPYGERPSISLELPEGRELALKRGGWRLASRGRPDDPPPAGWLAAYQGIDLPRNRPTEQAAIVPILVAGDLHVVGLHPTRIEIGAPTSLPILVMNFGESPARLELAARGEGPVEPVDTAGIEVRIEPGRSAVIELRIEARAEGLGRIEVQARLLDEPPAPWRTSALAIEATDG